MKNIINKNNVLNGIKLAAVALVFQAVIATTPATATQSASFQSLTHIAQIG